jgi:hypothetical protein
MLGVAQPIEFLSIWRGRRRHMAEDKVRENDFNLHTWFATIPMTDDVYLASRASNRRLGARTFAHSKMN